MEVSAVVAYNLRSSGSETIARERRTDVDKPMTLWMRLRLRERARTSEVRSVGQAGGDFAGLGDDVDDAFLYEVHLGADSALADDVVSRLEHLVLELRDHFRHEVGVGVREEWNGRDQRATVVVDDLLHTARHAMSQASNVAAVCTEVASHCGVFHGT